MPHINDTTTYEISVFHQYHQPQQLNNDYCILFTLSGSVHIQINNETYELHPQQLIALHPQDYYSIDADEKTTAAWIRFRYNFFTKTFSSKNPHLNLFQDNYNEATYNMLIQKTMQFIDKHFQSESDTYKAVFALEYITFLKNQAINENSNTTPLSKKEERILFIEDYIESNYMNSISLNDLAETIKLTPQYVSAFIKENMNTTFNHYLYKIRLSHAIRDMVATDDSLTHIAFNHGFPNISTFNRTFKEVYQRTPQSYRNQYKKNIDFFNANETPFPNYQESKKSYLDYRNLEKESERKNEKKTQVIIEKAPAKRLEHVWSKILNVGYAKDLNDFAINEHLRQILGNIPFTYGRITGLVHPDIMPYISESKLYDFREVDTVIDILYNLRLKPFIVLGKPEPIYSYNIQVHNIYSSAEYTDFPKAFTAFIRHCIMRYGIDELEQWKFEFAYNLVEASHFSENQFFYKFIKNSCEAYRILKQVSDKIQFGGIGHRLAQSDKDVIDILKIWKNNDVIPDFFTVYAYPMERINGHSFNTPLPISTNPHIHRSRMLEFQQHLTEIYNCDIPIYITELSFHYLNKKFISDSRFSAAYIIQSMSDLWDLCPAIALPAASDLHYLPVNSTTLLSGSNGIISVDGIRKPTYFALMLLNNLGNQLLYKTQGVLLSRHKDMSYRILLYNYKHPNPFYCSTPEYILPEEHYEEVFEDNLDAQFQIPLTFLPEDQYFIIEYTLDKEHGSIMDKWISCGKAQNLLHHMIVHLRQEIDIDFTYQQLQVNKDTVLNYSIHPHNLKMVTIYPVNAK